MSELSAGGAPRGKVGQSNVLALGFGLGAAVSIILRRANGLGLRIADSLGQHLVQLSLGLLWFARIGFCH